MVGQKGLPALTRIAGPARHVPRYRRLTDIETQLFLSSEACIDTMDGAELHEAGLACIRTAFGWVMTGEQAIHACLQTE